MTRFNLTDFECSLIQPLLPTKVRIVRRADDRRVLNGIFRRLRKGAPWADIPSCYGPHTTCVNRFNQRRRPGTRCRCAADQYRKASSLAQHSANAAEKAQACPRQVPLP